MYSPPSIIRKRFVSLLFLIQYTAAANDSGLQADYQEDSLASLPLASLDNTLPVASGPSQFTIPFTSGSATSEPYPDPQDGNDPKPFFLSSNEYCNSAAEQPYTSHRKRRKRQNGKTFCDNNDSTPGGASHQLLENNEIPKPKSPAQNSAPNPNGRGKIPNKNQPPINEGLHSFLYSMPGWDGEPNPAACNNPDYPLLQVPVCAPPAPQSVGRTSPAEYVVPCKFVPAEGCDKANEELWCCVMARQPDHEFMSSYLPPGEGIPDILKRYPASGLSCVQVSAAGA